MLYILLHNIYYKALGMVTSCFADSQIIYTNIINI